MNISLYLQDELVQRLDREVARRAAADKARGIAGHGVTSRSKLIAEVLDEYLKSCAPLPREEICYWATELGQQFGAASVSLFGSYARGEATATSDVDILLDKGQIKGLEVLDFQEALSQKLGRSVDVVTTAGASERFLKAIRADEVKLYEAV